MIKILNNLKGYGKEKTLWYHTHQGETFPVLMDTKKGYLVQRENVEKGNIWLVKHKHAESVTIPSDEDIVWPVSKDTE